MLEQWTVTLSVHFPLLGDEYLSLNVLEGRAVSYGSRFFHFNLGPECEARGHELKWKKQCAVTYSANRENEVSKMFIISLGN